MVYLKYIAITPVFVTISYIIILVCNLHITPGNGGPNTSWFIVSTQPVASTTVSVLIEYFLLDVRILI